MSIIPTNSKKDFQFILFDHTIEDNKLIYSTINGSLKKYLESITEWVCSDQKILQSNIILKVNDICLFIFKIPLFTPTLSKYSNANNSTKYNTRKL